ncbi:MAG: YdcF family protein [Crocinitomicaceae bacterium]|nr:YdcF family protein [Crocinitomicaceae bacterium]
MFFILSKALLFLITPIFWLGLAILGALFLKNELWKKRMKWTAVTMFFFFSNSVILSSFCRAWEVPGTKISKVKQHDVAIVLGGMSDYNNDLDELTIYRQADRIFQAITLYRTGKVKKILISGDSGYITDRGLHEAKQMKSILVKWGFPPEDILTEDISKNTHENAMETAKILKDHKELKTYLLVTSGTHMRRSLACFKKEGLNCTPFSTDLISNQTGSYHWDQYIIPNMDNFSYWNKLFKEMVGYLAYSAAGYI